MLAQSLVGHSKYRVVPTQVAAVKHAHAPYCYRCPFGLTFPSCELKCAHDIEELIQTTTTGQVAGIILEPILGVGGFITPPPGWMKLAVDIVRQVRRHLHLRRGADRLRPHRDDVGRRARRRGCPTS